MPTPMIVSASYRTDIPAFYADWFAERLKAGEVAVRNPYGGRDYHVSLKPCDVEGYIFWSRNLKPFMENLEAVDRQGTPFMVQMTVTGYPRTLETSTVTPDAAIGQIKAVARRFGPKAVVWRYDPIVLSSVTPVAQHLLIFERIARDLKGAVDECVVSFATPYAKTKRRLDGIGDGFRWWDPTADEKKALLSRLRDLAAEYGMALTVCAQPDLLVDGVIGAKCVDAERLAAIAGRPLTAPQKGNRPGCLCAQSRDIGAYDTCPHGCVYCYAVRNADKAKRAYADHQPDQPLLGA